MHPLYKGAGCGLKFSSLIKGPRSLGWGLEAPRDPPFSIIESRVPPGLDGFKTIVFFNAKLIEALLEAGLEGPRHFRKVAKSIKDVIQCKKIAISVIGLEVPHVHVHLIPINDMKDANFSKKVNLTNDDFIKISDLISKSFSSI